MTDYDFRDKRVFLSGPMTGMGDWNRAAFGDAESAVRGDWAHHVWNPARMAPRDGMPALPRERYMIRCLHELTSYIMAPRSGCVPYYDVIALLPGWEDSEGARLERAVAEAIGLEVVEL